jgi:hypothetical protein
MPFEQPNNGSELPEEIHVPDQVLKTTPDGKHYQYEKDGVYYGGDYLPESPQEIDPTFPAAPPEEPPAVI